jgi:L-threonylcarbamoyladenylate synthase
MDTILHPSSEHVAKAAEQLRSGSVIAFPTETVYGLGANAENDAAVLRIFELKGRPAYNPLIVHLADVGEIPRIASVDAHEAVARRLARVSPLWPGPLTVILPRAGKVSALVTAGGSTIGARIPSHPVAQALLRACGLPIAAPSANISFGVSPTTAQHVWDDFGTKVPLILDGGACPVGLESTVVNLTSPEVRILRPGIISKEQLELLLKEPVFVGEHSVSHAKNTALPAPGMLALHYAPRTPLIFLPEFITSFSAPSGSLLPPRGQRAFIAFSYAARERYGHEFHDTRTLSEYANPEEIARGLFSALRELDNSRCALIVVDTIAEDSLGLAIMDRLSRARRRNEQ